MDQTTFFWASIRANEWILPVALAIAMAENTTIFLTSSNAANRRLPPSSFGLDPIQSTYVKFNFHTGLSF